MCFTSSQTQWLFLSNDTGHGGNHCTCQSASQKTDMLEDIRDSLILKYTLLNCSLWEHTASSSNIGDWKIRAKIVMCLQKLSH